MEEEMRTQAGKSNVEEEIVDCQILKMLVIHKSKKVVSFPFPLPPFFVN
jgi:hypothetical protein